MASSTGWMTEDGLTWHSNGRDGRCGPGSGRLALSWLMWFAGFGRFECCAALSVVSGQCFASHLASMLSGGTILSAALFGGPLITSQSIVIPDRLLGSGDGTLEQDGLDARVLRTRWVTLPCGCGWCGRHSSNLVSPKMVPTLSRAR